MDDSELLRDYVQRDSEEAFAALVTRHVNKVYSVALRHTRNPLQAEEITQAVFVILAKKSRGLSRKVILSGWLYQTARLTALTSIRSEIRRIRREQEACMQTALEKPEPEIWPQIAPLLDAAMAGLSESDRHAVVLRYFDGKTIKEVGDALGASEDAAKMRLTRAVEKLRLYFTKRGVAHSAEALTATISAHSVQTAPVALAKAATALALAKSAAASGSTLTLIKGALKVMAWTKTKTAVVAAAALIVGLGTTTIIVKMIYSARLTALHHIEGAWEGNMNLGGAGLNPGETSRTRLVLKFLKRNGSYTAIANAIDSGQRNIPVSVDYTFPSVRLGVNPRMQFTGKMAADGTELAFDGLGVLKPTAAPDPVPEPLTDAEFAPRAGSDLQGYWKGTIGKGPNALPVDCKIAEQADGTFRAEFDNPNQGAMGQPAGVVYHRPQVKLALATRSGMMQGEINRDNTEINGSWIQGGGSDPAFLKRADYAAEHEQDALKDYTYRSENDLQGHWMGTWILPYGPVKVKMRYVLDIAKLPDGTYSAAIANIDQLGNSDPMPASDFQYSPPNLRMAWKWADSTRFEGKLRKGKIAGTWFEGGGGFALVFERKH